MGISAWESVGWLWRDKRTGENIAHCEECGKDVPVTICQVSEDCESAFCTKCGEEVLGD